MFFTIQLITPNIFLKYLKVGFSQIKKDVFCRNMNVQCHFHTARNANNNFHKKIIPLFSKTIHLLYISLDLYVGILLRTYAELQNTKFLI